MLVRASGVGHFAEASKSIYSQRPKEARLEVGENPDKPPLSAQDATPTSLIHPTYTYATRPAVRPPSISAHEHRDYIRLLLNYVCLDKFSR
jgi:hypothetical protein